MNIVIIVFASINFIYLSYYVTKMIKQVKSNKPSNRLDSVKNHKDTSVLIKEMTLFPRIIFTLFQIISIILFLVIATIIVWLPVITGIVYTPRFGLLVFLFLLFLFSMFWIANIESKKEQINDSQDAVIRESLVILFLLQIGFLIYFAGERSLQIMLEFIYLNSYFLSNTFMILFPIILISSMVLNIYLYIQDIRVKVSKKRDWVVKWTDILLILVASSFIGLLLLAEFDMPFIANLDKFNETKEIITMFLSAVLIPLVFNKVNKNKKEALKETDQQGNSKDNKWFLMTNMRWWFFSRVIKYHIDKESEREL